MNTFHRVFKVKDAKIHGGGSKAIFKLSPDSDSLVFTNYGKVIYGYSPHAGYQRVLETERLISGKGYWILLNDIVDMSELTIKIEKGDGSIS